MGKTMNQDRICQRAVFSVWSERAVERCMYYLMRINNEHYKSLISKYILSSG